MAIGTYVRRFPRIVGFARWLKARFGSPISGNYRALERDQIAPVLSRLRTAWQNEALPLRQRRLVDKQINDFRSRKPVPVFDVLVQAVQEVSSGRSGLSLLEVGCSSGYYYEVMKLAGTEITYRGCDYSAPLIALARSRYPNTAFDVEDAARLSYPDSAFDVVVSGCCLQHIPEYERAITETIRVARSSVIFHRTPVLVGAETAYFRKTAYGIDTFEIHFSESELVGLLHRCGLRITNTLTLTEEKLPSGVLRATRTYVCEVSG